MHGPGKTSLLAILLVLAGPSLACRTASVRPPPERDACPPAPYARDWVRDPAVVEIERFEGALYAVGDVHGTLAEFKELLVRAGLVALRGEDFDWTGGSAVLIQTGDLINKGPRSLGCIDFARALAEKAARGGGRALFLAGNHEIGFLAKAPTRWYRVIAEEARLRGLGDDVCEAVQSPKTPYGEWLRTRPAAAVINGVYFSHSGNSQGMSRAEIASFYTDLVDRADWGSKRGCGDVEARLQGFFNADVWWGPKGARLAGWLAALGVRQSVFGNDPNAFLAKGRLVGAFPDAALVKLDVGTAYHESRGAVLRCRAWRPDGGCAAFERLASPPSADGEAAFEPLPLLAEPPPQDEPAPHPWGC